MSQAIRITGTQGVYVSSRSNFNPAKPEEAKLENLSLFRLEDDGSDNPYWAKDGYIHVGLAKVEIELMPQKEVTTNAVAALRKQKEAVLAEAQQAATRIEGQIQSLLAITNEASA